MTIRRISLSLVVLVSCAGWHTAARAEDCHLKQLASLDITETPSGDLLVPISVAGTPRIFEVDLGAAFSAISVASADALSLKRGPMSISHRLSSVTIYGQSAPDISLAPLVLGNLRVGAELVVATPANSWTPSADGVLGLDILRTQDVELDIAHKKLNLFSPQHCAGQVVYWNAPGGYIATPITFQKLGNVVLQMRLDGKSVTATIDSAGPSRMTKSAARRIFLIDANSPSLGPLPDRLASGETTYSYPFKTLEVEGLTVNNPAIEIYDGGAGPECDGRMHNVSSEKTFVCYGGADIYVGLSVLRKLHLYFAFGEKTLYATAADLVADSSAMGAAPAPPAPQR